MQRWDTPPSQNPTCSLQSEMPEGRETQERKCVCKQKCVPPGVGGRPGGGGSSEPFVYLHPGCLTYLFPSGMCSPGCFEVWMLLLSGSWYRSLIVLSLSL